jgi:hypothetical protein
MLISAKVIPVAASQTHVTAGRKALGPTPSSNIVKSATRPVTIAAARHAR